MKIKLVYYESAKNGISLQLIPEGEIEDKLLKAFFVHGRMENGHPCGENGSTGFYINWNNERNPVTSTFKLPEELKKHLKDLG